MVSEIIATMGLILPILFVRKYDKNSVAIVVALFITAGYWFTSSTSFANPMVTISRVFTDTFTGIAPASIPYFLTGQIIAVFVAHFIYKIFDRYSIINNDEFPKKKLSNKITIFNNLTRYFSTKF